MVNALLSRFLYSVVIPESQLVVHSRRMLLGSVLVASLGALLITATPFVGSAHAAGAGPTIPGSPRSVVPCIGRLLHLSEEQMRRTDDFLEGPEGATLRARMAARRSDLERELEPKFAEGLRQIAPPQAYDRFRRDGRSALPEIVASLSREQRLELDVLRARLHREFRLESLRYPQDVKAAFDQWLYSSLLDRSQVASVRQYLSEARLELLLGRGKKFDQDLLRDLSSAEASLIMSWPDLILAKFACSGK